MTKYNLSENRVKFILACIIIGLDYLHNKGYAYRDLKPENILLTRLGYAKLSDFKLMRDISHVNFHDTSGTPGYMAPEIILNQNHGCASDLFSLGIIAYELMQNKLPYKCTSREEYKYSIVHEVNLIKNSDLPEGWSQESADFINKCIKKRPMSRIGYNSIEEIKDHRWFINIDWLDLKKNIIDSPYIPNKGFNFKPRPKSVNYYEYLDNHHIKNIKSYIEDIEVQGYFEGYFYDNNYRRLYEKSKNLNIKEEDKVNVIKKMIDEELGSNDSEDIEDNKNEDNDEYEELYNDEIDHHNLSDKTIINNLDELDDNSNINNSIGKLNESDLNYDYQ